MKNLSLCLFVLALSAVGCENKPTPKTGPVMPNPGTMSGHAGMAGPGAVVAPAEKKEGEAAAPAAAEEKKEGEAAAPAAAPEEKKEGEAAVPPEGEKKE